MCVELTKFSILEDNVKLVFKVGSSNLHSCSNCQQIFFTWSPKLDIYIFSFFFFFLINLVHKKDRVFRFLCFGFHFTAFNRGYLFMFIDVFFFFFPEKHHFKSFNILYWEVSFSYLLLESPIKSSILIYYNFKFSISDFRGD